MRYLHPLATAFLFVLLHWPHFPNCQGNNKNDKKEKREGCHPQKKMVITRIEPADNHKLRRVVIRCMVPQTVFDIRFHNGDLCVCGKLTTPYQDYQFSCKNVISDMPVQVKLSVNFKGQGTKSCTISLAYYNSAGSFNHSRRLKLTWVRTNLRISRIMSSHVETLDVVQSTLGGVISSTVYGSPSNVVSKTSPEGLVVKPTAVVSVAMTSPELSSYGLQSMFTKTSGRFSQYSQTLTSTKTSKLSSHSPPIPTKTSELSTRTSVVITSSLVHLSVFTHSSVIQPSPTTDLIPSSSTLSPIDREEKQYNDDVNLINKVNTSTVDINDKNIIQNILNAASNVIRSNRTEEKDPGMKAVNVLQDLGETISRQLDLGNESQVTFQQTTDDLVFGVAAINTNTSLGFTFPVVENNSPVGDEKVEIPQSVFSSSSGKAFFVGIIFNGVREMRNKTGDGFFLGSKIINAEISPTPPAFLKDPVELTFRKSLEGHSYQEDCSFWIVNKSLSGEHDRWSTKQCVEIFQNRTHIKCACSHFTNFAVLFKITSDENMFEEHSFRLVIITYVGLGLSILGCLLTFIIYISLRNIKSDRSTIHTNLVLALGIADVLFLVSVIIEPVKDTCLALTMLAFFFYLAVFFWMFVEGIYIYLMVIKVFRGNTRRRRRLAYLVGWGCPVVICVVTWAILRGDVVSKYHCWLSVESGAIWAFVGPGLLIILFNMVLLVAVMRTTWATFVDDKEYGGMRSAVKTLAAVIPILGVTWVFGVMAFNETSVVFQYIFAITNSIQGILIFILYCLVNGEVRKEFRRRMVVWQTRRDMTDATTSGTRRPTYMVGSDKFTTFNRTTQSGDSTPDVPRYKMERSPKIALNYSFEQIDEPGKQSENQDSEFPATSVKSDSEFGTTSGKSDSEPGTTSGKSDSEVGAISGKSDSEVGAISGKSSHAKQDGGW